MRKLKRDIREDPEKERRRETRIRKRKDRQMENCGQYLITLKPSTIETIHLERNRHEYTD